MCEDITGGAVGLGAQSLLWVWGLLRVREVEKLLVLGTRVVQAEGSWVGKVEWQR